METIVALAVITAAVVGPVYLITRGLLSSSYSKNKLIASNLAQESIESFRAVRENNIICNFLIADPNNPWDWLVDSTGVGGAGSLLGTGRAVDTTKTDSITCNGKTLQNPQIRSGCDAYLTQDNNGHYGYGGANTTIFKRCVDLSHPAADEGPISKNDVVDATSTVTWNERNQNQSVIVRERFYNWR